MRGDQPQVACAWTAVERSRAKRRARLTCWSRVAHKYRGDLGRDTGGVQPHCRGMARLLQPDLVRRRRRNLVIVRDADGAPSAMSSGARLRGAAAAVRA